MTLESWHNIGCLRPHETGQQEAKSILELVERDLADASREEVSTDWRFNIAYAENLLHTVQGFKTEVETWLSQNHPNIYP